MTAYLSRPTTQRRWPGLVLVHEWWGLDQNSRDLSRRLAAEGFTVVVPDLYEGRLTDDWREAARLKVTLDANRAATKVGDAAAFLRTLPDVGERIGVLGFCLGGGIALLATTRSTEFACGVIFYHSLFPDEADLAVIRCPLQCHFGTADPYTPLTEVTKLQRVLDANGVPYSFEFYEGAGHAFFNDRLHEDQEEMNAAVGKYDPAANRAATAASWEKTKAFLHAQLDGA